MFFHFVHLGGIAVALAFTISSDVNSRAYFITSAIIVVMFTIFIQGSTIGFFLSCFGLKDNSRSLISTAKELGKENKELGDDIAILNFLLERIDRLELQLHNYPAPDRPDVLGSENSEFLEFRNALFKSKRLTILKVLFFQD